MNIIKNYNVALKALYDHVGFVEDWVVYPISDVTEMYWSIDEDSCRFARSKEDLLNVERGEYYEDEIYRQRFYDKHVYEGKEYTMVFCNPNVDGMKWFRVFDNKKRVE